VAINAFVNRARGELAMTTGDPVTAATHFSSAVRLLQELEMPIESALAGTRVTGQSDGISG
jgi:hypothetical protein